MKRVIAGMAVLGGLVAAVLWSHRPQPPAAPLALVERFCTDCHNAGELAGGLRLEGRDAARLHDEADVWEAVIRKVGAGLMPPPGEPRPPASELAGLVHWLEDALDAHASAHPNPGAPVLHRLNRAEYANAIRDMLALPVDATTLLPADDASEGFDNVASALIVSPAHMQAYVAAAAKISRLAVGDPTVSPAMASYSAPSGLDQAFHVDGLPLGTRGGLGVTHVFPLDAEYEITARRVGGGLFLDTVGGDEDLEVTLDGERLALIPAGSQSRLRAPISAGPHEIGAALIADSRPAGVDDLYAVHARSAGVTGLSIMGPFGAMGPGDTPSRRRIFVCTPGLEDHVFPDRKKIAAGVRAVMAG